MLAAERTTIARAIAAARRKREEVEEAAELEEAESLRTLAAYDMPERESETVEAVAAANAEAVAVLGGRSSQLRSQRSCRFAFDTWRTHGELSQVRSAEIAKPDERESFRQRLRLIAVLHAWRHDARRKGALRQTLRHAGYGDVSRFRRGVAAWKRCASRAAARRASTRRVEIALLQRSWSTWRDSSAERAMLESAVYAGVRLAHLVAPDDWARKLMEEEKAGAAGGIAVLVRAAAARSAAEIAAQMHETLKAERSRMLRMRAEDETMAMARRVALESEAAERRAQRVARVAAERLGSRRLRRGFRTWSNGYLAWRRCRHLQLAILRVQRRPRLLTYFYQWRTQCDAAKMAGAMVLAREAAAVRVAVARAEVAAAKEDAREGRKAAAEMAREREAIAAHAAVEVSLRATAEATAEEATAEAIRARRAEVATGWAAAAARDEAATAKLDASTARAEADAARSQSRASEAFIAAREAAVAAREAAVISSQSALEKAKRVEEEEAESSLSRAAGSAGAVAAAGLGGVIPIAVSGLKGVASGARDVMRTIFTPFTPQRHRTRLARTVPTGAQANERHYVPRDLQAWAATGELPERVNGRNDLMDDADDDDDGDVRAALFTIEWPIEKEAPAMAERARAQSGASAEPRCLVEHAEEEFTRRRAPPQEQSMQLGPGCRWRDGVAEHEPSS